MTLVVDASVAVKWFFEEAGHRHARALLDGGEPLFAPSLVLVEIANVAWKRHRRGELSRDEALGVVRLSAGPFAQLFPVEDLVDQAASLALDQKHPIYDCLYLALAERERAPLATADRRLAALARECGIKAEHLGG